MKFDSVLLIVAVVAVVVSVIGVGITYNYVSIFKNTLTGLATDTAIVNLTVSESIAVNFTTDNIDWGIGQVNISAGCTYAILETNGTVFCGNWTAVSAPLILENIGNKNVTLDLVSNETAIGFLGGTSPSYQYNITNDDASSCKNGTTDVDAFALGQWYAINTTGDGTQVCSALNYQAAHNSIAIDVKLQVPSDSKTGLRNAKWTATVASV